jgi:chromate transporter
MPAVEAAFKGIRPAVVALIAAPLVKMAKTALQTENAELKFQNYLPLLVSLAAALLIWLGHVNPVWVILATIIITIFAEWLNNQMTKW